MSEQRTLGHLSFTRLKELSHSPLALKNYIEQKKETTAAMTEGNLLDCLLFEPEKFDERFLCIPKVSRATKEGKALFTEALDTCAGRSIITEEQKAEADFLHACISNNSTVVYHGLLNPEFFKFQVPISFFYNGFLHKGVKDADGHRRDGVRTIWDLKRMGAKSGEHLVRAQIRNNKYDLQAAIYCHELDQAGEPVKYYVIAVDNDGYVTPFEITRDARLKARIEWNILLKAAHRLDMEGLDAGCEFWAEQDGFFYF